MVWPHGTLAELYLILLAYPQESVPMSHEEVANYLRFSPETVSRVITKLQQSGIIEAERRHIRILDVAQLEKVAQGV